MNSKYKMSQSEIDLLLTQNRLLEAEEVIRFCYFWAEELSAIKPNPILDNCKAYIDKYQIKS